MKIRPYEPTDIDAVIQIFRSNIPKYFRPNEESGLTEFLSELHADEYFVIELDGEIVASGGIGLNDDDTVSLCWGMVRGKNLGMGLGRLLTEFRFDVASERYPRLPLVISTSQHTTGFYEKFGFALLERIKDGFGPGLDNCKMRKEN